jgi:alpha-tubulin suppressor-like RCC1 family protein
MNAKMHCSNFHNTARRIPQLTHRAGRHFCVFTLAVLLAAMLTASSYATQVFSWGRDYYGQLEVPATLNNAVAISAGYQHCLALRSDGTVAVWGQNTNGQLNVPASVSNNVTAVCAGWYHNLALLNDGSLVAWGAGLTNFAANHDYGQCIIPPNVTNILAFAAGRYFSMALLSDRTVAVWGENLYGQTNIPAGLTNVAAITAGGLHCMALKGDGTVVCWGGNGSGESSVPAGLSNIVAIAADNYNSYAIRSDGSLVEWGDNTVGQATIPAGVSNVVMASGGTYFGMAIEDSGNPASWGQYDSALPAGLTNVIAITAGFYMGLALTNDGTPVITAQPPSRWIFQGNDTALRALASGSPPITYQWSFNGVPIPDATNATLLLPAVQTTDAGTYSFTATNSLGSVYSSNATLTVIQQPPILTAQAGSKVTYRFGSATFTAAAVGSPPLAYQWQLNGTNLPNATNATLSYANVLPSQTGNYSLVVSNQFGMTVSTNAYLTILAVIDYGASLSVPLSLTSAVAIAAGVANGMALKPDNTLVVWGNNTYHQTNIPPGATNIMALAAGGNTCAIIRSNGTVLMWGDNYFPGIGTSKTNPPASATNVVALAIGDNHCLALRNDGTVVGWGNNTYGQTNIPASATNIMAIAVGSQHSLLLRSNGTLLAWGYNGNGQTNIPAGLGLTNVVAIAAAGAYNFALKADGSAYAWGVSSVSYPNTLNIVRVATGYSSSASFTILRGDGSIIGNGGSGVSNAVAISSCGAHSLFLLGDGSPNLYWPPNALPASHPGDNVSTRVNASGVGPMYYQWQLNGTNIVGATNAVLSLTNIPITLAGVYSCIISNALGVVTSPGTTLAIQRLPLQFASSPGATQMTTNGFKLRVTGLAGQGSLIVYSSTNLVDWLPIQTNPPTVGSFDILDPNATNQPSLFYKASEGQ